MARATEWEEESSVPRLLSALYRRGFTGHAKVQEDSDQCTIFYRAGRVVKVQRVDGLDRLGDVLVQGRLASKAAVDDAVRLYGQNEDELAAALGRSAAVGVATVRAGIRLQLSRQLARAFFCQHPRFEVAAGEHRFRGADASGGEVDPRIVIYPGIRAAYDEARLRRELAPFAGGRARLLPVSPAFLRETGFREQDQPILAALTGPGLEVSDGWLRAESRASGGAPHAVVLALAEPAATPGPRRRTGVTGMSALDPATVARMAEAFFKNGDQGRAERAFQVALKSDPQNPRTQAFAAWLEFWKPSTDRPAALPRTMKKMKEAVQADTQFAYGHYFLGSLHKVANEPNAAIRSFRAALEADAGMVDAQRELRLLSMRKRGGSRKTA
jgi:hypothetical protein